MCLGRVYGDDRRRRVLISLRVAFMRRGDSRTGRSVDLQDYDVVSPYARAPATVDGDQNVSLNLDLGEGRILDVNLVGNAGLISSPTNMRPAGATNRHHPVSYTHLTLPTK